MKDSVNINGIVLAGGKSSRMGSPKGLLDLNGRPFISHITAAMQPLVHELFIVSDDATYDHFEGIRVPDIYTNAGPVGGIYAGLMRSPSFYNLILSCDVPLINSTVLNILINNIEEGYDVIQLESEGQTLPLVAIYTQDCVAHFKNLLAAGERRLRTAVTGLRVKTIPLDASLTSFVQNINTQTEYNSIKNELKY